MSDIATKLTTIAENQQKVYTAGRRQGYSEGYEDGMYDGSDTEGAYNNGVTDGKQAEYDRFWDEFQALGTRMNYMMAFAGNGWETNCNPKYDIVITANYGASMFQWFCIAAKARVDMTELCKKIDFSGATNIQSLFQNAKAENITLDLSNCTNATNAFNCNSGGQVNHITLKVTEKLTSASQMFLYNTELTDLTFTDDSVLAVPVTLQRCPGLTAESAKSVLRAAKDFTGTEKEYSCTASFHDNVWLLLDAEGNTAPGDITWRQYADAKKWNI